ncbi:MAG: GrpB family protein [Clostridia bacterium]|nr:GrpB family protein [Clostridia bacterium]
MKSILGTTAVDIQHIGSTAVKSICAKPIIDIAVGVNSFDEILKKKAELEESGFYFRESRVENQLLFACGSYYDGTGEKQTHFIHAVIHGGSEWQNYLLFRDYLNENITAAKEYEALKLKLAEECPVDSGREHYLSGKHGFIRNLIRTALIKKYLGKTVKIEIDRPVGHIHKKEKYTIVYPVNYGYIPGAYGGDGEELDVYLLGVDEPVKQYTCKIIGAVLRKNDVEDKLIAVPEGISFTVDEAYKQIEFQEQWYDTEIKLYN